MAATPRSAVVTGASRGIGRAIALRFAAAGHRTWALARDVEALASLARDAEGEVRPLAFDAADPLAPSRAAEAILGDGAPEVLVNNAGIALSAALGSTSTDDYEHVMAINVRAPFLLCRELIPSMVKAGGGRVINIASTAALKGFKYTSAYCASKHALLGLTRALAVEFATKHVTVNAVCPGWTDTELLARSAENISRATGRSTDEALKALAHMNPMGRLIRPEEVAGLCVFLASPAASAVTGAAYTIDAGELA